MSAKKPRKAKPSSRKSGDGPGGEKEHRPGAELTVEEPVTESEAPSGAVSVGVGEPSAETQEQPGEAQARPGEQPTVPLEQHQRLLAEFDNYRKRTDRERARLEALAAGNLALQLLPVLDDFERATAALGADQQTFDREGILIIEQRLAEALKREGLREVEASPGDRFDPEIHEAVLTVPSDAHAEGHLAEVLQRGYAFGDRLLRASRVVVSSGPAQDPAGAGGEG